MDKFDFIVVGGGMAGLSAAAFITMAGRSVLVLEKHDKVGGLASSFERRGVRFDLGIEGVRELAPDSFLPPFLRWWGVELPMVERRETMSVHTPRGNYRIRGECARDDLVAAFPGSTGRIDRFFRINEGIVAEMTSGSSPKPPDEMSLFEKLRFGVGSALRRPNLFRYGLKNCSRIIPELFDDGDLARVAASKTFEDMVYLGVAHRWEAFGSGKLMYPNGGIGALPEAVAASIRAKGGVVRLSSEVRAIRQAGRRFEAECADGGHYVADRVIVAAPMPWAAYRLFDGDERFDGLRSAIARRKAFPACFMSFIALDPSFDLGGANVIVDWADEGPAPALWKARRAGRDLAAATAPLSCVVAGAGGNTSHNAPIAMTVAATLGWGYASAWGTGDGQGSGTKVHSAEPGLARASIWSGAPKLYGRFGEYAGIKAAAERTVLDRLEARLGNGFRDAVLWSFSATPLSFARHTNGPGGSYMGFSILAGEYGRFIPQRSPLPGLCFAGQWVFPGFGVAGAAASGYYAAKALLRDSGEDLDARIRTLEASR